MKGKVRSEHELNWLCYCDAEMVDSHFVAEDCDHFDVGNAAEPALTADGVEMTH